jgi:putative transposase
MIGGDDMIQTIKVMLCPNNKQVTKMFGIAGAARFAYNWSLAIEDENHKAGGKFIQDRDLRKKFTELKTTNEYSWLYNYSNNATKQAIKDACVAFKNFFEGRTKHPKFKSKRRSIPKFYVDTAKIQFTETHVKLEGFAKSRKSNHQKANWIRLAEHGRIPVNARYYNPRVKFDGLHWWLTVGVDVVETCEIPKNQGIGIDLGIKDLAICSDGNTYKNINKSKKIKRLERKKRRLQRKVSRKYRINKKGERYCKTRNITKCERETLIVTRKIGNIRHNHMLQAISEIVNRKPKFIVLEDLNVKGMMKNRHLSKAVQAQCFNEFRSIMEYKCECSNIQLIIADRFFPSSKTCSCCGEIKHDLTLKDRTFV